MSSTILDIRPTSRSHAVISAKDIAALPISNMFLWEISILTDTWEIKWWNWISWIDPLIDWYLPLSWWTLTGDLILNADPTNPLWAATKQYVDSLIVWLLDDRWNRDASTNLYPNTWWSGIAWAILKWDIWYISVAWNLWGNPVLVWYSVRALVDTPWQTSSNRDILSIWLWYIPENVANKATDFSVLNNILYPTTLAVSNYIPSYLIWAISTVLTSDLTVSRAIISNWSWKIAVSAVTDTELWYVSGVTSAIQTQINWKQPLDSTLTALAAFNSNWIITQTALDTFVARTITAWSWISITNGNWVSWNPTVSVDSTTLSWVVRISITWVDAKTIATHTILTVPVGKQFVTTHINARINTVTWAGNWPRISLGTNAATYNNIMLNQSMWALDNTAEGWINVIQNIMHIAQAGESITLNLSLAATTTTMLCDFDLIWYYI